jgi:hypothetical protein
MSQFAYLLFLGFDEMIKKIIPTVIGIMDKKYVPKVVLPESPSISGSLISQQKKMKAIPRKINNAPAMPMATFQNSLYGFILFRITSFLWPFFNS